MIEDADKRFRTVHRIGEQGDDQDFRWADEEPDDDLGGWRMHTEMLEEENIRF